MILVFAGPAGGLEGMVRGLKEEGHAVTVDRETDLGSMQAVRQAVKAAAPEAIILAAGLDDPEACERDEGAAFAQNAERAINVAAAALEFRCTPVLLSTAEVFGQSGGPWSEADTPEPPSIYAESKLRGEAFITRAAPGALVVRTGPVLDDGLTDFAARLDSDVTAADDELVSPVGAVDLGRALSALLAAEARGVVHVANGGAPVSRAELLVRIADALGLDRGRVTAAPGRSLERAARWARAATLHTDRLNKVLDAPPRSWLAALAEAAEVAAPAPPPAARGGGGPRAVEVFTPHPTGAAHGTVLALTRAPDYAAAQLSIDAGRHVGAELLRGGPRTFHVTEGKVLLEVGDEDHVLRPGRSAHVPAGVEYRLTAVDAATVLMVWPGGEGAEPTS